MKGLTHMEHSEPDTMGDLNDNPENYPPGLRIYLTEKELEKIGLDMPKVGEMVHLMAMTKVCSTHASDGAAGPGSGVCLQITHMKAEVEDSEDIGDNEPKDTRTPAQKIYGKK